ncbi:hypothetical protein R5W24_005103 [Gemmata sp. JC717]|uniref:hypothetical protein n=1 Tax=Gemmata algarum TaxID=2975278 RepID=UPI0021BA8885|nr:hypothetical protein [Gemmata algarum]MDY3555957.1 hypothetical protein [Gemmata algarum]
MISRKRWEQGHSAGEMIRSALHWAKNPERKARLYRAALVRRVWDELPWLSQVLTELAERQADGEDVEAQLARPLEYLAEGVYLSATIPISHHGIHLFPNEYLDDYERYLIDAGYCKPPDANHAAAKLTPERLTAITWLAYNQHIEWCGPRDLSAGRGQDSIPILRDIFGNPFRPVTFSPAWRTDTALALARQMYESRDFGAMPILADALQDAGCDSDDIRSHCRGEVPHVRGCWVVDLVLGKG